MAHHYASGLYKLSVTLLVFSCIGLVFGIIGLANKDSNETVASKAMSLVAYIIQIAVCALGIHGAKTYRAAPLIVGAILCGIVVAFDLVLAIITGIALGVVVAAGTIEGGVAVGALVLALAVIFLILPVLFFILYVIEFVLLIKHAKRAHGGLPSETTYVKV